MVGSGRISVGNGEYFVGLNTDHHCVARIIRHFILLTDF